MSPTPRSQTGAKAETVLEAQAPAFSTREAEAFAQQAFGIRAIAQPLHSERDQNFRLRAKDGSEWVLKIANPAENPAILDMQTQALLHIARVDPRLAIPRVKATPDGALFHEIDGADGRRFIARVLSFLPGQLLEDATLHPALLRNVGAMTARLARALRGFFHPAAWHELLWDLTQAPGLRAHTHTTSKKPAAAASSRRFLITSTRKCFPSFRNSARRSFTTTSMHRTPWLPVTASLASSTSVTSFTRRWSVILRCRFPS